MSLVDVSNVSKNLVTLRLNSGRSLILEPGVSSELLEQEIKGNAKVEKLAGQGVITVQAKGRQAATEKPEKKSSSAKVP